MEQFEELNLKRLTEILFKHIGIIISVTLIAGILSFIYSETMVLPEYESTVSIYVNNKVAEDSTRVLTSDIAAAQMLVNTYMVIIKSDTVLNQVAARLEEEGIEGYHAKILRGSITAQSVDDTEVLKITVRDTDKKNTFMIANIIAEVAPDIIKEYVEASSVKVVDYAVEGVKVAPNIQKNMLVGLVLGFLFASVYVILKEIFDMRIKTEDDLEQWFKIPILGVIPDISDANMTSKTGYYSYRRGSKTYEYARKEAKENNGK